MCRLCKGAKLEVKAETDLIYQCYGSVTSLNTIAFIGSGVRDMQADLFIVESAVNVKVIKNLLYFICDNKREDKVFSKVTNPYRGKLSQLFFSNVLVCDLFLKLLWQYY